MPFDQDLPKYDISASSTTLRTDAHKKDKANRINNTDAYKSEDGHGALVEFQEGAQGQDRGELASSRKKKLTKSYLLATYGQWLKTHRNP